MRRNVQRILRVRNDLLHFPGHSYRIDRLSFSFVPILPVPRKRQRVILLILCTTREKYAFIICTVRVHSNDLSHRTAKYLEIFHVQRGRVVCDYFQLSNIIFYMTSDILSTQMELTFGKYYSKCSTGQGETSVNLSKENRCATNCQHFHEIYCEIFTNCQQ